MRRRAVIIRAIGALLATAPPTAAGEVDAAFTVTAIVLDRCAVGAEVGGAMQPAVRLSLQCPGQSGCTASFGPLDEPQPVEVAGVERCRLALRILPAPLVTSTPQLFQVDF